MGVHLFFYSNGHTGYAGWCLVNGEKLFIWKDILFAFFIGFLLLFIGNGAVAWSEQFLASSVVAVFLASAPIWFVLLDYGKWKANFSSPAIISGLVTGFTGIIFLFKENMGDALSGNGDKWEVISIGVLVIDFNWHEVSTSAWLAVVYLVTMGSLLGYSAYVWLLKVRPATQVSTHAYVNPVVAVLLGVFFAGEKISALQITGLAIILAGVLLVNLARYRKQQ